MALRRNQCVSVLLTLVVSASASGARGQATQGNPPQTAIGTIRGVVSAIQQEEKLPLEGIQVELKEDGGDSQRPVESVTDSEGRYEFRKLPSFLLTADREKAEQCFVPWEAGFQRVGTLMCSADEKAASKNATGSACSSADSSVKVMSSPPRGPVPKRISRPTS
jgi:hypothetical protein